MQPEGLTSEEKITWDLLDRIHCGWLHEIKRSSIEDNEAAKKAGTKYIPTTEEEIYWRERSKNPWKVTLIFHLMKEETLHRMIHDLRRQDVLLLNEILLHDGGTEYAAACYALRIMDQVTVNSLSKTILSGAKGYFAKMKLPAKSKRRMAMEATYKNAVSSLLFEPFIASAEKIPITNMLQEYYEGRMPLQHMKAEFRERYEMSLLHNVPTDKMTALSYGAYDDTSAKSIMDTVKPIRSRTLKEQEIHAIEMHVRTAEGTGLVSQWAQQTRNVKEGEETPYISKEEAMAEYYKANSDTLVIEDDESTEDN